MGHRSLIEETVSKLDRCIQALAAEFKAPKFVLKSGTRVFRHADAEKSNVLACYLKAVRLASAFNASLALLRNGYVQEVYMLCRVIAEASGDILFLCFQLGEEEPPTNDQGRSFGEAAQIIPEA